MTTQSGRPPSAAPASTALVDALTSLRDATVRTRFGLRLPGADRAAALRTELIRQLDDYLLPRLRKADAPLLTVIGGSTGAGKSTLVNSLIRTPISPASALRPTTRSPVLVCHPYDLHWFSDGRVLPELTRTSMSTDDPTTIQLVSVADLTPGLAVLDAPDLDSVVTQNRRLATQLLAAADLWLFVTTAARYADAVPWEALHAARSRGTALAILLDRVPPSAEDEVRTHLRELLAVNQLGEAPLFVIPETPLAAELLPEALVAPLRAWLDRIGGNPAERAAVVRRTLDGALRSLGPRCTVLAAQAHAHQEAAARLRDEVEAAYLAGLRTVDDGVRDGTLLRGEVTARWQEFIGAGGRLGDLSARFGRWRGQLTAAVTGSPDPRRRLTAAVEAALSRLLIDTAEQASERVAGVWRADAVGAALLRGPAAALARPSNGFAAAARRTVRDWQTGVLAQVRGAQAPGSARMPSEQVAAVGVLVTIVLLSTAGMPNAPEALIVEPRRALGALLGDAVTARWMVESARSDLLDRIADLLTTEQNRYGTVLDEHAAGQGAVATLDAAITAMERAR